MTTQKIYVYADPFTSVVETYRTPAKMNDCPDNKEEPPLAEQIRNIASGFTKMMNSSANERRLKAEADFPKVYPVLAQYLKDEAVKGEKSAVFGKSHMMPKNAVWTVELRNLLIAELVKQGFHDAKASYSGEYVYVAWGLT